MKHSIILVILIIATNCTAQWSKFTLTSGNSDRNPVFADRYTSYNSILYKDFEFMVLERHVGVYSQICAAKIGINGVTGGIVQITSNSSLKRNPSISYGTNYASMAGSTIINGLVIWEDNQNGKWDLYASSYDTTSGWSAAYPFDTTSSNKSSVKCIGRDSCIFTVVYEKGGDIIYRQLNSKTKTVLADTNLTPAIPEICGNPRVCISYFNPQVIYVSYEKTKADTNKAIYYKKKNGTTWSNEDTIAYLGNNINNGFASNFSMGVEGVFESNRTGYYKIYHTQISPSPGTQNLAINQPLNNASYSSYKNFLYPIITKSLYGQVYTYIIKSDSTKLFISNFNDSTTLGNSLVQTRQSINNGVFYNNLIMIWVLYTKDSLGFTNIYGKKTLISLGSINKIGNDVPANYSLSQNYPNPFNQTTNIKHQITNNSFISLKVFDVAGREVITLVNENLEAGNYEIRFDTGELSSGIYFYTLTAGDYKKTRKMILLR